MNKLKIVLPNFKEVAQMAKFRQIWSHWLKGPSQLFGPESCRVCETESHFYREIRPISLDLRAQRDIAKKPTRLLDLVSFQK